MKKKLKAKTYEIVARAVEEGAAYGVQRAYRYTDKPTREAIAQDVACAVTAALCDVIDFD